MRSGLSARQGRHAASADTWKAKTRAPSARNVAVLPQAGIVCRAEVVSSPSLATVPASTSSSHGTGNDSVPDAGAIPGVAPAVLTPASPVGMGDQSGIMAAKITAVASKINAARELARRLSEERQAAQQPGSPDTLRNMEEASAAAAAQAARADSLARALRKAESTRDQMQKLRAENEALRKLLLDLAADKEAAHTRLAQVSAESSLSTSSGTSLSGSMDDGMSSSLAPSRSLNPLLGFAPPPMTPPRLAPAGGATLPMPPPVPLPAPPRPDLPGTAPGVPGLQDASSQAAAVSSGVGTPPRPRQARPPVFDAMLSVEDESPDAERPHHIPEPDMLSAPSVLPPGADIAAAQAANVGPVQPMQLPPPLSAAPAPQAAPPRAAMAAPPASPAAPTRPLATPAGPAPFSPWSPPTVTPVPRAAAPPESAAPPHAPQRPAAAPVLPQPAPPVSAAPAAAPPAAPAAPVAPPALAPAPAPPVVEVAPPPDVQAPAVFAVPAVGALAAPARQAAAPSVRDRVMATPPQLQQLARMAVQGGQQLFTLPAQPIAINGPVRLFYNRAKGPLPNNAALVLKLGLNKWELLQDIDMKPAEVMQRNHEQDWYEVTLELPDDIFKLDFVVYDRRSGQYDNNNAKDFALDLTGCPTPQQLAERRLEAYRAFEAARVRYLEAENAKLWRQVELAALEAASSARLEYRRKREDELRASAQLLVAQRRRPELRDLKTQAYVPGVFKWLTPPVAGKKALLAYNLGQGPMSGCNSVRLHIGYDGWHDQIKAEYELSPMGNDDINRHGLRNGVSGNHHWYACMVDIPHSGAVLNFVFSDRDQRQWDNNNYNDYHTAVDGAQSGQQLADLMYTALKQDSQAADQVAEDNVAKRAGRKVHMRGEALKRRRGAMNQFLYTSPYVPVAGQKMDVFYNPEHTPLRGRPDIFLRAGWNRWSLNRNQPLTSVRMTPVLTGNIGFYQAELTVPEGAWSCDLVFIDTEDPQKATGFFDNNGGLDYHVPVRSGAQAASSSNLGVLTSLPPVHTPLKIVHIAVEMAPIAKVGGMGDVVTALGRAVQEEGHQVECIIPKYDCINYSHVQQLRQEGGFSFGGTQVRVWKGVVDGLPTTFLEPENGHFWRGCIYGRNDDSVRFGFFCGAALQYLRAYSVNASILHCHDWPSAPVAWGDRNGAKCIFTIHNLSYGADLVGRAMAACDVATTVSPTYAQEVSGHNAVAPHLGKLYGIRNGIDTDVWDPTSDPYLPAPYSPDMPHEGKEAARRALRTKLGLSQIDVPIVGCVTRLVAQKGMHLIKHAAWRTLERGAQFVLLGSAPDARVQGEFNALRDQLKAQYHDRAALIFQYDEPLSHQIYAGCDMFLVPSIFEPCGLTQMIAMQYGTVPVVRKTGGLADTVFDVDHDEERAAAAGMETNGFVFESVDAAGMDYALNRALSTWYSDKAGWRQLVQRVMRQDWSWFSPALDYVELYYKALRS